MTPTQFDVFLDPLKNKGLYPLVVVLQSPFANLADARIVAPAIRSQSAYSLGGLLTPQFTLNGQAYTLQTFQLTLIKVADLRSRVTNISELRDPITKALDHLFHDNA